MRVRAGWLEASGHPRPFAIEGGELVCLACDESYADREAFMAHGCVSAPEPETGEEIDA